MRAMSLSLTLFLISPGVRFCTYASTIWSTDLVGTALPAPPLAPATDPDGLLALDSAFGASAPPAFFILMVSPLSGISLVISPVLLPETLVASAGLEPSLLPTFFIRIVSAASPTVDALSLTVLDVAVSPAAPVRAFVAGTSPAAAGLTVLAVS